MGLAGHTIYNFTNTQKFYSPWLGRVGVEGDGFIIPYSAVLIIPFYVLNSDFR